MSRRWRERLITLGMIVAVIGVWYTIAAILVAGDDPLANSKAPYPHLVAERMFDARDTLADAAWTTLRQAILGFAIGAAVAIVLSVIMAQAAWIEASLIPFVLASQMIPMIALVPISQNVFKDDDVTRLFISAYITFFSVTISVVRGLKAAPPPAFDLMRSYSAGRMKTLRYLTFPAALPLLFTGLRIAAPLSLVGSVLVDLTGAQTGLGYIMLAALTFGSSSGTIMWAAMIILLVLGFLMSQAVILAERVIAPWTLQSRAAGARA